GQPGDDLVHRQLLDGGGFEEQGPGLGGPVVPGRQGSDDPVAAGWGRASIPEGRADTGGQGCSRVRVDLCPAWFRVHARLQRRPEGIPGRVPQPGPEEDVRCRPRRGSDQGGHRQGSRSVTPRLVAITTSGGPPSITSAG